MQNILHSNPEIGYSHQWRGFDSNRFKKIFKASKRAQYMKRFLDSEPPYAGYSDLQRELLHEVLQGEFNQNDQNAVNKLYTTLNLVNVDERQPNIHLKRLIVETFDNFQKWNIRYYVYFGILQDEVHSLLRDIGIEYEGNYLRELFSKGKIKSGKVAGLPKTTLKEQTDGVEPVTFKGKQYTTKADLIEFIMKKKSFKEISNQLEKRIDDRVLNKPRPQSFIEV